MKYTVAYVLILAAMVWAEERKDQQGFLVYKGPNCISVTAGPNTQVEFPMVNGEPDKKHGRLIKPIVDINLTQRKDGTFTSVCSGEIQIRLINKGHEVEPLVVR